MPTPSPILARPLIVALIMAVLGLAIFGTANLLQRGSSNDMMAEDCPDNPATAASIVPVCLVFTPVADMYVVESKESRINGTAADLQVAASPHVISYLRFDVQGLSGTVARATLRVYVRSGPKTGYEVRRVLDSNWNEDEIAEGRPPAVVPTGLGPSEIASAGSWTTVDVTSLVHGEGRVELALTAAGKSSIRLASRESGALSPRLIIETDPILIAAGDIADCRPYARETAKLLDQLSGIVATLGDNVYERGTPQEFRDCYERSWGRHKARTRPAPGNHEYLTPGAAGYFLYFGALAGDPFRGYYSYNLGTWHIIVINSECAAVGGCHTGSPQEQWLRADLAAHPATCTLAYWHLPRFSSGLMGSFRLLQPIWEALYEAGVDVVLSAHDHLYERFAPQTPDGRADPERGIRQFTVGTGGAELFEFKTPLANSEVRSNDTHGVLKLTLRPTGYDWEFVPVAGATFRDAGSGSCH